MEIGDYETVKTEMILSDFEFIVGYENLYKINKILNGFEELNKHII